MSLPLERATPATAISLPGKQQTRSKRGHGIASGQCTRLLPLLVVEGCGWVRLDDKRRTNQWMLLLLPHTHVGHILKKKRVHNSCEEGMRSRVSRVLLRERRRASRSA